MPLILPLTIILGISTITSLFITAIFGFLVHRGKEVFKYHKFFAVLTLVLAVTHAISVILKTYF